MKSIGKAAGEFVSKAVRALRRKARVLLFLASPRRRAVAFAGISRHIRALTPRQLCHQEKAAAAAAAQRQPQHYCRGARRPVAPADDDDDDEGVASVAAGAGLPHRLPVVPAASSLLLVVQEKGDGDGDGDGSDGKWCAADWTLALRSLFDDDEDGHSGGGDGYLVKAAANGLDDEEDDGTSSVIDVIRRRREGDGQEFRIEDEIDRAADMYITRVRRRMTAQLEDLM